jgi:hypothetical protein
MRRRRGETDSRGCGVDSVRNAASAQSIERINGSGGGESRDDAGRSDGRRWLMMVVICVGMVGADADAQTAG